MIGLDNNSLNQRLNGLDMAGQSAAEKYFSFLVRIVTFNWKNNLLMFSFIQFASRRRSLGVRK